MDETVEVLLSYPFHDSLFYRHGSNVIGLPFCNVSRKLVSTRSSEFLVSINSHT